MKVAIQVQASESIGTTTQTEVDEADVARFMSRVTPLITEAINENNNLKALDGQLIPEKYV